MEEQLPGNEPESGLADLEMKRPDEAIKDLEPDEQEAEDVTGGARGDYFLKLEGIDGESQD